MPSSNRSASRASITTFALLALVLGATACSDDPATPSSVAADYCRLTSRMCPEYLEGSTVEECQVDRTDYFDMMYVDLSEEISPSCAQAFLDFFDCFLGKIRSCDLETGITPAELDGCDNGLEVHCEVTWEEVLN
jgi:hypothetical protein